MSNVILDTGVWFGYFVKRGLFHEDARALVKELFVSSKKILLPEVVRFELLNVLTHELLNHQKVQEINDELRRLAPYVENRYGDVHFWDNVLPANLFRIFLRDFDFIIASYALYWDVDAFYSFDEKLNRAMRRLKPEIVKLKIRKGHVIRD
ncbi:MAG: type II toxin-antitoxin system VapC family toxin [bacterium]